MTRDNKINFLINVFYTFVVVLLLYFSIRFLLIYLFPVIIGVVITIIVQKPSNFLHKKIKIKKGIIALFLVIVTYISLMFGITYLTIRVGTFVAQAALNGEEMLNSVANTFNYMTQNIPEIIREPVFNTLTNLVDSITGFATSAAKNTAKFMPVFLTSVIVTIIASCYIAKDYDRFKASIASVIRQKYKKAVVMFKDLMQESIFKILKGYLIILLITFAEILVGLFLLGVKNVLIYAVCIAILDLLPIIGTGTILIPWGIIELINSNYFFGAGLIILYIVIMIVRNIIEPKIIGKQIGLHPLITLVAVFIGFRLFGFIGIIALPLGVMLVWKMFEKGIFDILHSTE